MTPEEVDYFLTYNELKDDVEHRLLLRFRTSYAVILLNDLGLPIIAHLDEFKGQRVSELAHTDFAETLALSVSNVQHVDTAPSKQKPHSWVVHYDGQHLLIPSKAGPTTSKLLPPAIGIVITGKSNIEAGNEILGASVLGKQVPTPFLVDEWGDSWNDSFDLEPRVVDSMPSTVFACINGILAAGKNAFNAQNYDVSATKYRKAFHYCHKYYPETLEPQDLATFTDLKLRSLLNLALASLKTNSPEWLSRCVEACELVLGMPECEGTNRAKALYRLGSAYIALGDDELAKRQFELSWQIHQDPQTRLMLQQCEKAYELRTAALKQSLRKGFARGGLNEV